MKMRKLVAVLVAVLMLCCIIPFSAMAEGSSASIDFGDKANRVSYSTSQQVWAQNGITVTNDKAASTSNVGDYGGDGYPVRFYKGSAVTVEYPGMTKIEFNCDDYKASYATDLQASISGATATLNGTVVTVAFDAPVDSFVVEQLVAQVRVDSIVVYTGNGGGAPIVPDEPDVPGAEDPEADTELSIADAVALGLSKEHNTYTEGKYFVTGVITEVYSTQWGNMYITDGNGNTLTIYGSYSADGELRYDAMDVQPVAGDTVTVYGIIGQYNGKPQIKNGWITSHIPGETPDEPDVPVEPDEPAAGVVTNPVAGVPYKLGIDQTQKGAIYYFTGAMSTFYGATDTDISLAVYMFVEIVEGGYKLYFNDANGAKQYIKLVQSGTHYNFTFGAEASVFTLDAEKNAFCAPCGDQICYMGTYGSYVTVGTLTTEKLKDTDYIARLYAVGGETPDEPDEPVIPDEPDVPTGETLTIAEAIALGLSKEHNTYTEGKYFVTGVITEVYSTQWGNMYITDGNGNTLTIYGSYSADGELRYDAMDVKPVAGDTVTIYGIVGQYNGTPQIKNGWIVEHIPAEIPDEPDEPVTPDEPDEPVVPSEPVAPSVDTAFKFGMTQGNLENKVFYLAGGMDGYYMATTEDINAAIDVYLEETEGGFYFYTIENGAKKYINMVVSGTHVNGAYEDAASTVYTYDAEAQTLVADVEGASYWFATRNDNTYTTMGPCKTEYQGFYGKFYTADGEPVEPENPDEPGTDSPVTGDNGTVYVTLAVVLMALAAAAAFITSKKRA